MPFGPIYFWGKLEAGVEWLLLTKLGRMQPRNYHNTFVRNLAESGHRIFSYDIPQLAHSGSFHQYRISDQIWTTTDKLCPTFEPLGQPKIK